MHFAIVEPALILLLVSRIKYAEALFSILYVLSFISDTITVIIDAYTMHLTVFPLTMVRTAILEMVNAQTLKLVIYPFTIILAACFPVVSTNTILLAQLVLTNVF